MARQIHWKIPFRSFNGLYFEVCIFEEDYEGEIVTLKGGAEPFTINEDDVDDDVFTPYISSTGNISFIDEDGVADDILPKKLLDRYVELRISNTTISWAGFLKMEQYSGEWGPLPMEVSLPVISLLGILDYIPYQPNVARTTMGTIINRAIGGHGIAINSITIADTAGDEFHRHKASDWIFSEKVSFEEYKYGGEDPKLPAPNDGATCLEVLTEIAKFYGWTIREEGLNMFFTADDFTDKYFTVTPSQLTQSTALPVHSQRTAVPLPDICSAEGERSVVPAYGQIRLIQHSNIYDRKLISLSEIFDTLRRGNMDISNHEDWKTSHPNAPTYLTQRLYGNDLITMPSYNFYGMEAAFTRVATPYINRHVADICNDAYMQNITYAPLASLSPVLILGHINSDMTQYAAKIESLEKFDFTGQADNLILSLSFDAESWTYKSEYWQSDESPKDAVVAFCLVFNTPRGKFYYNGEQSKWLYMASDDPFPYSTRIYITGRTIDSAYADGIDIPVPSMEGYFTLYIANKGVARQTPAEDTTKFTRIKDVVLQVVPKFSATMSEFWMKGDNDLHFNRSLDVNNDRVYSQECQFKRRTWRYVEPLNLSLVSGVDEAYQFPIDKALDRMQNIYGNSLTVIQTDVRSCQLSPYRRITYNGEEYVMGPRTINYRDEKTTIKLYKL